MAEITTKATLLKSGAVSVHYNTGEIWGFIAFNAEGRTINVSRSAVKEKRAIHCELRDIGLEIWNAALACRKAALKEKSEEADWKKMLGGSGI